MGGVIKEEIPNVKTVFGNYHSTFTYDRILENYPNVADYVVLGEGEQTLLELVEVLENGGSIKKVKGIAFQQNDKVVKTPQRPPIQNLDELPFPDRTLLKNEYRSEIMGVVGCSSKFTTMVTSRGCPFNCKFCSCSAFTHRKIRFRSPKNVVEELEKLQNQGYEEVGFVDDNLLLDKKRIKKICDMIKEKGIELNLWGEGRVDQASREVLKQLASVGCKTFYFGMESGLQRVLDYYRKGTTSQLNRKAVKNSRKAGIENIIGSFIVGAPIETPTDVRKTFDFILGLKEMDFPQINVLCINSGTDFWDTLVKKGYLDENKAWQDPVVAVDVFPSKITRNELENMINNFYEEFVKRPSYIVYQLMKILKSRYRMKVLKKNIETGISFKSLRQFLWNR